ncbi:MAG: MFS transporter, partial [Oscillospiraceae bacterium]|nr:MFS transporter [Oscillospiraceae bacterium]
MAVSENDPQGIAYNRSYVGIKETAAYLLNDFSNSFNIKQYENRFVWDVLKIDIGAQALVGWFTGAWDVINDLGIGVMVDKTRTRWGKFRPYLLGFQIPTSLLGMLYWFLPLLFRGTSATYLPKLIAFFAFGVLQETAGTFTTIARSGYMTTITPNPNERGRLILLAELLTGYMGEDMPNIITGLLLDLVNNSVLHWRLSSVFIGMGTITAVVSCVFTLWFFLKSRERVLQSVERPS